MTYANHSHLRCRLPPLLIHGEPSSYVTLVKLPPIIRWGLEGFLSLLHVAKSICAQEVSGRLLAWKMGEWTLGALHGADSPRESQVAVEESA